MDPSKEEEALDAWFTNDKQGIIEMATATGKTVVGLSAIIKIYEDSFKLNTNNPKYKKLDVLILTHSKAILNQWRREAIEKLGLNGNPTDNYTKPIIYCGLRISFNTLQTVYRTPTAYRADFLIVDEVHHSAAYDYRKALEMSCKYKMGLSATIEGQQKISYLKNYLGDKVYTLSIKEARERSIIQNLNGISMLPTLIHRNQSLIKSRMT